MPFPSCLTSQYRDNICLSTVDSQPKSENMLIFITLPSEKSKYQPGVMHVASLSVWETEGESDSRTALGAQEM